MQKTAAILLIVLSLAVFSPLSVSAGHQHNDGAVIVDLDICHMSDAHLSAGSEMMAVNETIDAFFGPAVSGYIESPQQTFSGLLIPFRQEKPPKA